MPLGSIHTNLGHIACQACGGDDEDSGSGAMSAAMQDAFVGANTAASGLDKDFLSQDLELKIKESNAAVARLSSDVYDKWTSLINQRSNIFDKLEDFVERHLVVAIDKQDALTEMQEKLLVILLQSSNFVFFLETEENQEEAYGTKTKAIADLKGRLLQVVCAARQLLADFTDDEIQEFVKQHVHYTLHMTSVSAGLRRAVCALALRRMNTCLDAVTFD